MNQQVSLVNGLMRSELAEHKLAAILYIQLFWLGKQKNYLPPEPDLRLVYERYIHDWNTIDWLSVKVLAFLIDSGDEQVIWTLKRWNCDPYLWKARASLVPFAHAKSIKAMHSKSIKLFSDILITARRALCQNRRGMGYA